ncbi:sugar phosphate isomerase/epimerase family protein [Salibacterium aidingense]|uniref:sugar phosphate isomerase/epimerase family protein n=1 Tax=Salibacterium aidingense TaxID=384933 RepID=UPI0012EB2A81|nr:TIM barrel protein [Salibacterium aidingense]
MNQYIFFIIKYTYHVYTAEDRFQDIAALAPEEIIHVHVNDAENLAKEDLLDNDRIWPGEGVIDIKGFLQALQTTGYDGPVSQEVLTQELPQQEPETLIQQTAAAYDELFK